MTESKTATKSPSPLAVLIVLVILWAGIYGQTIGFDFINYDDPAYVTENPMVLAGWGGGGASWALGATGRTNLWHPVTWWSHQMDAMVFGPVTAWGPHLVNALLHLLAALLAWRFATLAGVKTLSAWVAVLFLVHPTRVQTVAWVSERKELLAAVFALTAALMACQAAKGAARKWLWWAGAAAFLSASLAAKPLAVGFGLWWVAWRTSVRAQGAAGAARRETWVPATIFLVLGLAVSVVTLIHQQQGGIGEWASHRSWWEGVANGWAGLWSYAGMVIRPWPLPLWIYPASKPPVLEALAAVALLGGVGWAAWRHRRQVPACWLGWVWAVVFWLPVSGLVTVSYYAVADRYLYVPWLGILTCFAGFAEERLRIMPRLRRPLTLGLALLAAIWSVLSVLRASHWKSSEALFTYEMQVNPRSLLAPIHLGQVRLSKGQFEQALMLFQMAAEKDPRSGLAHGNVGHALRRMGRDEEALLAYRKAQKLGQTEPDVSLNLAMILDQAGNSVEAASIVSMALDQHPRHAGLWAAQGYLLSIRQGKRKEGILAVEKAVHLAPSVAGYQQLRERLLSLDSEPSRK